VSLFDWLLVCHLAGDFLLQSNNMAKRKADDWAWMFRHIAAYMVAITIMIVRYTIRHGLPAWLALTALLFVAGTHIILDRRGFTNWWMRRVIKTSDRPWLTIVADQVFHVITLAIVAQVLALARG
jgi:hypothetical protein